MKNWFDHAYIYHIMIDRFCGHKNMKNGNCFLGGTLKDIEQRLDYIIQLGCNAIWLSPFYKTKNYHGYHITDFMEVDPHFGSLDDLKGLIRSAHQKGLHIIADYVPNHCADTHPYFAEARNNTHSPYRDWFYFDENGRYKCFMNYEELPKLNLDNPHTRRYMIEVAKYWCDLGIDSLRIDHAIGPSFGFWQEWMKEMKNSYPHKVFFGEVWSAGLTKDLFQTVHLRNVWEKRTKGVNQEELQKDYIGVLDGVLDFAFREIILTYIIRGEKLFGNKALRKELKNHFSKYNKRFKLVLFLDNHDTDRILFHCKGETARKEEAIAFCKSLGFPFVIYYGTEANMMNKTTITDGRPYADLDVREILFNKDNS